MHITNYSDLRKNLAKEMDKVLEDQTPTIVTRGSKEPIIMMPLADFNSYEETIYLLKSPENRKRLEQSIKDIKNLKYHKRKLIENDED